MNNYSWLEGLGIFHMFTRTTLTNILTSVIFEPILYNAHRGCVVTSFCLISQSLLSCLPHVISTLVGTLLNQTWKLSFGTQRVAHDIPLHEFYVEVDQIYGNGIGGMHWPQRYLTPKFLSTILLIIGLKSMIVREIINTRYVGVFEHLTVPI